MVNNKNRSAYEGSPPAFPSSEHRHYIENGPIYELQSIAKALESGENSLILWTRECIKDVQDKLELEMSDLLPLFQMITTGDATYLKSEWCIQKPNGSWAACDSYNVTREEWIKYAKKYMDITYYIKFAISKSGKLLLTISCHTSK